MESCESSGVELSGVEAGSEYAAFIRDGPWIPVWANICEGKKEIS